MTAETFISVRTRQIAIVFLESSCSSSPGPNREIASKEDRRHSLTAVTPMAELVKLNYFPLAVEAQSRYSPQYAE